MGDGSQRFREEVNGTVTFMEVLLHGYCAARKMSARHAASQAACAIALLKYFGYKLVMISTLKGLPIAYELVPANLDERQAVEGVLEMVRNSDIYGDKGFIGQSGQQQMTSSTGNKIWTIHRDNQYHQPSARVKRLIAKVRQRIERGSPRRRRAQGQVSLEGIFHEIQNTGRNPERLLSKTVRGLSTHMAAKIASHTLRLLLRDRSHKNNRYAVRSKTFFLIAVWQDRVL